MMFKSTSTALLLTTLFNCQLHPYTLAFSSYPTEIQDCSNTPCGTNAFCDVKLGRPTCACQPGCSGNPYTNCRRDECSNGNECPGYQSCRNGACIESENPCYPSPCGTNATCDVKNGLTTCSCLPGYVGSGFSGCRHECECDDDCLDSEMCSKYKCSPVCQQCGKFALCVSMKNHRVICECPKGYGGNPYTECIDLCDPNPCGTNAECTPDINRYVCTCLPGYIGDPLLGCIRGECIANEDCADNCACVGCKCVNPCIGQCGLGADCTVKRHLASCCCPPGTAGDPFVACQEIGMYPITRYVGRSSCRACL